MPVQKRTCAKCESEFVLLPGKPGLAIHCPACSVETTPRVMGKVSWDGKHLQLLEITADREAAMAFNRAQQHSGGLVGPLSVFNVGRDLADGEASKAGSGAEGGAVYRSRLGGDAGRQEVVYDYWPL